MASRKRQTANNIMIMISFDVTLFQIGINSQIFMVKTQKQVMNGQLMTIDKEWPFADVYKESEESQSSSKNDKPQKRNTRKKGIPEREVSFRKRTRSSSDELEKDQTSIITRSQSQSRSPPPPPILTKRRKKSLTSNKHKTYPITDSQKSETITPPPSPDRTPMKKEKPTKKKETPTKKKETPTKKKEKPTEKKVKETKKKKEMTKIEKTKTDGNGPDDPNDQDAIDSEGDDKMGDRLEFRGESLCVYTENGERRIIIQMIDGDDLENSRKEIECRRPSKTIAEQWFGLQLNTSTICQKMCKNPERFGWTYLTLELIKSINAIALKRHYLNDDHDALRDSESTVLMLLWKENDKWVPTGT